MGLRKTNSAPQHNDRQYAQRARKEQLKFILANKEGLLKVRGGEDYYNAADEMNRQDYPFTDKQLSFIDTIYEKMMKGLGYGSCQTTFKPKRGLRF